MRNLLHHATLRLACRYLSITAYKSRVLFKKGIEDFIQKNHLEQSMDATCKKPPGDSTLSRRFLRFWSVIGSDGSRKTALTCPLTVAAAYVSKESIATLKDGRSRF